MILLAIALALAITFSEILIKYERKLLKHIVNRYLLIYLFVNGILASIVYLILPGVSSLLSQEIVPKVESDSWIRALIAGLTPAKKFIVFYAFLSHNVRREIT